MRKFHGKQHRRAAREQRQFDRAMRAASPAMQQELTAAAARTLPR
jgi:hypothetical protein